MKKTIKVLCIAMLLSGAVAKAETEHKNVTWAGIANDYLVEGPKQSMIRLGAIATGGFAGGVVGLFFDRAVAAQRNDQKLLAILGAAGVGALTYYQGEQLVADTLGKEKIGLAKTSATMILVATMLPTFFGTSITEKFQHPNN